MTRRIEQQISNISYEGSKRKIKFKDWFLETDPPNWTDAEFEFMNKPVDGGSERHKFCAKDSYKKHRLKENQR